MISLAQEVIVGAYFAQMIISVQSQKIKQPIMLLLCI